MSALYRLPCHTLTLLLLVCVIRIVTNGGGIDEQLCTLQCHQSCCFWIPLIPAYQYAQFTYRGLDGLESQVSRRKVELLVIAWVVGDVHLAVFPCYGTVLL